jgi:DNA invertase Pin-like site-specific DNA recombinase
MTSTSAAYISAHSPRKSTPPHRAASGFIRIFAALAEFERGLIIERTRAGMKAARARTKATDDLCSVRIVLTVSEWTNLSDFVPAIR